MSADPAIARARIEIASDRALLKKLAATELAEGLPRSAETQARINSLLRLIAANEKRLVRMGG